MQAALIGRREEVIHDLMDIIDNESNRPLKYENRLWSFILNLEAFVELNLETNEALLNETVLAIDYVLEHLEKKTSTPGEIQKFLTLVFYAQATLVECYTKIVRLDRANEVRTRFLLRYIFLSRQKSRRKMSEDVRYLQPCNRSFRMFVVVDRVPHRWALNRE
jgi:hypothetical protein